MRVRLKLKQPYTWPSRDPKKPSQGQVNFAQTRLTINLGDVVSFEDLQATSLAGDLNTNHYKHYEGRKYKSVPPPFSTISCELAEI
jgi:hypothetical protein